MSMVHASSDKLKPASPDAALGAAIVAGLAKATLPASKVDWRVPRGRLRSHSRSDRTVEDSMSMVHASSDKLKPASPDAALGAAIVAGLA
ncbi:hypothetical protein CQA67_32570, partial [Klebsiella pneumoniae]